MTWISNLADSHLACRSLGHRWADPTKFTYRKLIGYQMVCFSCTTRRIEVRDSNGEMLTRSYMYPADYNKPPDEEAVRRSRMWVEYRGRLNDLSEEQVPIAMRAMLGMKLELT